MGGTIDGAGLRISRRRKLRLGVWLLFLLPAAVVFLICYRPVMRLKPQPPAGFVETRENWDAVRQSSENRAAQAYWQLAANFVQERYAFGTELPVQPIDEFRLDEKHFPRNSVAADPATRLRYWSKLRQIWSVPNAWSQKYVWNTGWLRESLSAALDAAMKFPESIVARFSH